MEAHIGIKPENLVKAAQRLAVMLADEMVLSTKTRNAHWNVEGTDFYSKHTFFDSQYEQLDEIIDAMAERIRSMGHYAPASFKEWLQLTRLTEQSRSANTSEGFIKELLADHESIIRHLRENIHPLAEEHHDVGSSDLVTEWMEIHEKMAWMLRAHLKS